jgi:hypothetical protein
VNGDLVAKPNAGLSLKSDFLDAGVDQRFSSRSMDKATRAAKTVVPSSQFVESLQKHFPCTTAELSPNAQPALLPTMMSVAAQPNDSHGQPNNATRPSKWAVFVSPRSDSDSD